MLNACLIKVKNQTDEHEMSGPVSPMIRDMKAIRGGGRGRYKKSVIVGRICLKGRPTLSAWSVFFFRITTQLQCVEDSEPGHVIDGVLCSEQQKETKGDRVRGRSGC